MTTTTTTTTCTVARSETPSASMLHILLLVLGIVLAGLCNRLMWTQLGMNPNPSAVKSQQLRMMNN